MQQNKNKMTVNFEYIDHLESMHPSMSVMVQYSVFADVKNGMVTLTSIRGKVCSLLFEGEYGMLDIPVFGNNRETNKMLSLFTDLAIEKYESEKIERANQTA